MLEFDFDLKFKKRAILFYVLGGILLVLSCLLFLLEKASPLFLLCVFMVAFCFCYPMLLKKLIVTITIRNALRSDSIFFSQTFFCEFFEEYLEQKSTQSALMIYYPQLYKAYEIPDAFYLYQSRQKAIILPKANFTLGSPQDFSLFLQQKAGDRFFPAVS